MALFVILYKKRDRPPANHELVFHPCCQDGKAILYLCFSKYEWVNPTQ